MKSYTDIEQSKKLAEILSNESSDMYYWCGESIRLGGYKAKDKDYDIPCWSLAALLDVIPRPSLLHLFNGWRCDTYNEERTSYLLGVISDNPIDTCVDMILKLKEKNLI